MGFLSSWAVSSFAHHIVTEYAATCLGVSIEDYKYILLGDDKVDSDEAVALLYRKTIIDLGVSINRNKSTESKKGYTEVAKRFFSPKGEITGLPVSMLERLRDDPSEILEFLKTCNQRGYTINKLRGLYSNYVDKVVKNS